MKRGAGFGALKLSRAFSQTSTAAKGVSSEKIHDPARIAEAGIVTRDVMDWVGRDQESPPSLDYQIGDKRLRAASHAAHRIARRAELNQRRAAFAERGEKTKLAFEYAGEKRMKEKSEKGLSERHSEHSR